MPRTKPNTQIKEAVLAGLAEAPPAGEILWRPVVCAKHYWEGEKCDCPPGPQVRAWLRGEFEILYGGARGGGKSELGRAWLMKGNPDEPQDHLPECPEPHGKGQCTCGASVNASYLNHPRYRALVLRKNQTDLLDWIDRARALYSPLGGKFTDRPPSIEFPSQAKIIVGHMADEDAYEKYMGQEFHRMVLEELTQIPSEILYKRITASCRSTFRCSRGCAPGTCRCGALNQQVLITANPGGPGSAWVKARFVSIKKPDGTYVRPNESYTDPLTKLTRIYIPAKVSDNPFLVRDTQYVAQLMDLPEAQRRAWLEGDWDALSGQFFTQFRPRGPLSGEPPEARHVVDPGEVPLQPWWPRTIGMDWGYRHATAVYWGCYTPSGQIVIYRERIFQGSDPDYIGAEIARESAKELYELGRGMALWISPETIGHAKDERTVGYQVQLGIAQVLGPDSVQVFQPEDLGQVQGDALTDHEAIKRWQRNSGILIRRARNQRIDGWQWMHSLMRFRQIAAADPGKFDQAYAQELLLKHGADRYFSYLDSFKPREREVLPRLLITTDCPVLAEAIPGAIHEDGTEDVLKTELTQDDALDAARYLLMGMKYEQEKLPLREFTERRLAEAERVSPGVSQSSSRFWVEDVARREWEAQQTQPGLNVGRASRASRRIHVA